MDLNELLKNPDQIKNLIDVLQSLLPKQQDVKTEIGQQSDENEAPTNPIKTRGGSRPSIKKGANKFERMSEFTMHKDDAIIDKALSKIPPVARAREEMSLIEVTCRVCGRKENISPTLIFDSISRYKCNNCATQAG